MQHILISCFVFCLIGFFALPSQAQQLVDTSGNWRVLKVENGGNLTCYIASLPVESKGNFKKRGEPYLLVTSKSPTIDEVSASAGYPFDEKKDVQLVFGQKNYKLFARSEVAWAYDADTDKAIVKDMMRGSRVVVHGQSWKGTDSKDTYSLKGFTNAHRKMKQLCQ